MSRIPQSAGARGSLKWIQRAVNAHADLLDADILPSLGGARTVEWVSPLAADDFAEYRDGAFLKRIGHGELAGTLAGFWPTRGPQWDALARSNARDVLLVEAKAHVDEMCSSPTDAKGVSRERIEAALARTIAACGAKPKAPWTEVFYQLANRLAHLHFLRDAGVPAWLVLVNFVGDTEMKGPNTADEWRAAYRVAEHVMGLSARHALSPYIIHTHPQVERLV